MNKKVCELEDDKDFIEIANQYKYDERKSVNLKKLQVAKPNIIVLEDSDSFSSTELKKPKLLCSLDDNVKTKNPVTRK